MTKPFRTIAANALAVTLADPFFLILHMTLLILAGILTALPGFTAGEHLRLLRDQNMALLFMIGSLAVIFGLIRTVTDDFRRGAGAVLLSRPIGNFGLILGKWLGMLTAVLLLMTSGGICCVWLAEVAGDGEHLQQASMVTYFVTILAGIGLAGGRHYLLRGSFPTWANLALTGTLALGLLLRLAVSSDRTAFDWPILQGVLLLLLALAAFAAILVPVALVADSALVLTAGIVIFFVGLLSNHFLRSLFGSTFAGRMLRAVTPDWQIYWVADQLAEQSFVPVGYLLSCLVHAGAFVLLFTAIATVILGRMEVHADG